MKIKIQQQPEIEVYVSDHGYIAMKSYGFCDEQVVLVLPENARKLCRLIMSQIDRAKQAQAEHLQSEEK